MVKDITTSHFWTLMCMGYDMQRIWDANYIDNSETIYLDYKDYVPYSSRVWETLHLKLKHTWQVYPIDSRPIDFIGYRYGRDFTLLRKDTKQRFEKLCNRILRNNYCSEHDYRSLCSYYGVLKWCDSTKLWNKYYSRILPILKRQGYFVKKFHSNKTRKPKDKLKSEKGES